ncbi:MAG: hypothetical protein J0J14_13085 [Hyphomicrobium sp.]|nr:hypothetical protein [Hyphomicrobium sp.]
MLERRILMTDTFPEDYELLAFFETEPKALDPGEPWFYNRLDFEVERAGSLVQCRLSPSYGQIDVRLHRGERELARFELEGVKALKVHMEGERELLVAEFEREEKLVLMLKPHVWVGLTAFRTEMPASMLTS